ncbi:ArdC family protein [Caballeronia humi]|uniref:Antirestriction protein-like protein n=1 Tax=Caballeronia humi TaxID=326474 RepID=A0A158IUE7_9BURK|nr:zincin-like metallopeptidase domain-containing protein [Caballeronia humi]SAL60274.1 antirestriction protein-like protein [Caballeronia humi]
MKGEPKSDVYTRVTDKIIADLEHGVRPWAKPWETDNATTRITLPVRANGILYRGINVLLLWGEALAKGYRSNRWMTFKQALELGASVRKGEHGSLVVYANTVTKIDENDDGEVTELDIAFMKGYTVFNVEQIDNLPEGHRVEPATEHQPNAVPLQLIEFAETFFGKTRATVCHGGNRAFYAPGLDIVQLPPAEAFDTAESYESVKAHEITHWTSHYTRLNRQLGKRFGDEAYAAEELIAEMGAAFLCAQLGIAPETRADHASYLDHWLKVLKADKKAIFTAAGHAQRACDYLFSLQAETPSEVAA